MIMRSFNFFSVRNIISFLGLTMLFLVPNIALASENAGNNNQFENDMDPQLIGTGNILQVQIEQNGKVKIFPVHGATLSFLDNGSFKYDYTSESNEERASDIAIGDQISPTVTSPVATCKMVATGEAVGQITAYKDATSDSDERHMFAYISLGETIRPEVRCEGSADIITNATTPPIGAGRPSGVNINGTFIAYRYEIDMNNSAITDMEIWSISDNPVRVRYYLRKFD